ncbi:hypothetical protein E2C01_052687 [Portunus trituberculatus]|uniref:Uncharacterized protein n=1 Tax=Portunus trituberculatus TaxID=210409 RepID=A0A5B7GED8_PORTR|nr:hypothetical protein [Portunus trituberculatus]
MGELRLFRATKDNCNEAEHILVCETWPLINAKEKRMQYNYFPLLSMLPYGSEAEKILKAAPTDGSGVANTNCVGGR